MTRFRQTGWRLLLKAGFDRVAAAFALLLLSPLLAAVSILVWASMGRPVLFRQTRPGYGGRPFSLVKFRTMRNAFAPDGLPLPDGQRMTWVGRFLRSSSLDELPELWNIVRGELSFVGPRPLLMKYLPLYTPQQARRHDVLPGITGWAQIHGRNSLSWEEKFELDLWYVDHWSLTLDLKILYRTIGSVLKQEGISNAGHVTMPEYRGPCERSQPR